ncbi:paraquat-inducible protein A [Jeongeupia naejangsanensis]|uniref:Paraquat-inducible protein A n=1 Tax=Jeongeupia naejangsanensis TaxID=613195 RepID=A0ABS2BMX8_9NEIS|nr:paraquat-inducible protein A [Jeongeupia naejangsanensis]MBM3116982.1 paraquat-inducible protein A [Jeongeupia naejangsanensis]
MTTARQMRLAGCHDCGLLARLPHEHGHCPRCGGALHFRKPGSLAKTWALLIAAMILYIPANTLPMMITGSIVGTQSDTILSGVVYLWTSGDWPIAALVFFASIMVPLLKMIAILLLLITCQRRSRWAPQQRTRLYRLVEFVGRWSMLDIYVVTILAALVQVQSLASIAAGPAAVAFAIVVVLTMLSAMSFDPRLIWDPVDEEQEIPGETHDANH